MSANTLVTIFCDAPSCGEWRDEGVGDSASEARARLRHLGWRVNVRDPEGGRRLDFCPRHADRSGL